MTDIPLAVLDLVPVSAGDTPHDALRNTVDLARRAEEFGYRRYWFAEHHLNPGLLGVSPAVAIALVAGATSTIRLGSAGVQSGHRTPLSVVEEFGLIDALHPGRLDLGIGRSPGRPAPTNGASPNGASANGASANGGSAPGAATSAPALVSAAAAAYQASLGGADHSTDQRAANGLLIPRRFDFSTLLGSPRLGLTLSLLQQPGAYTPEYADQIDDVLALLRDTYHAADGQTARAWPGAGAAVEVWILGASGGSSASVAGSRGLRFAASYHHSPSTVLDAVEAYRAAFEPSTDLAAPYVSVSADVVVGEDDASAARLASGYGLWVRSIRSGAGAIPFPSPQEAAAHTWSDADREQVADRVATQLVGSPSTVADRLEQLAAATGADELAVTTITHRHADRVRSYELLAAEWARRHG
ncbi:LLM class flavin-dependent oxidoreductase [Frankia sp. QA3]|uniref:LLM class flavin-dependent oxidoreductase n=1 Tax=Frankia sp. QA3 TaxID=710111 RepID=UPI000269B84F|nr:LLM class flavin-dependent oxidoreductase [Frankia sp. QA3]EIV90709.1 flavin-dependent oxidoreductase, F420-dependent methylene-tetrahydromethanopterin reductase [Frankia sp. QA3]